MLPLQSTDRAQMGQPESFHLVALGQIVESRRLLNLAQLLSFFTAIDVENRD